MAEERFLSPEKQLLDIIEGSKPKQEANKINIVPSTATVTPPADKYVIHQSSSEHRNLSLFSISAWLGRISYLRQRFKQSSKTGQLESEIVGLTNRILSFAIGLCILYFLIDFSYSMLNAKRVPKINFNPQSNLQSLSVPDESLLKNISYYLEKVRQRDIFKIGSKPVSKERDKDEIQVKIAELTQDLKLVGISWSDDPDAMIEDAKNKKTYFIKRGQDVGELKVQAIFKDKVVLSYQGVEVEIK